MYKLWKIRQHHWKERLKISKPTRFESGAPQACEGKAPQNCEKLQTFVWWGGGGVGWGASLCRHTVGIKGPWNFAALRSCIFVSFQQITFKLGNFNKLKGAHSSVSDGFSLTSPCQKLRKTVERCIYPYPCTETVYWSVSNVCVCLLYE